MQKNKQIIFRADGNPTIGMGHFTRTLALAEMLNEHFHCIFATRQPTEYQIAQVERICHSRIDLPEDGSHFDRFLAHLKGNEIVVLDNYYFTTEYQKAIRAKGCKLVCIDDMHDKHYVADVVINHAEGVVPSAFSTESHTKLLLGYRYALVRKEFTEHTPKPEEKKYAFLVMMGGADPYDITNTIVQMLKKSGFDKPVAIVKGVSPKNDNNNSLKNFRFFDKLNAKQVSQLMTESDFGIFPASTVAIEACAVRLPFICGYFIDNQIEVYEGIKKNELAVCIGNYQKMNTTIFMKAIKSISNINIRESIIERQIARLDGKAPKRYLELFLKS